MLQKTAGPSAGAGKGDDLSMGVACGTGGDRNP
jgi:hypothetical protein